MLLLFELDTTQIIVLHPAGEAYNGEVKCFSFSSWLWTKLITYTHCAETMYYDFSMHMPAFKSKVFPWVMSSVAIQQRNQIIPGTWFFSWWLSQQCTALQLSSPIIIRSWLQGYGNPSKTELNHLNENQIKNKQTKKLYYGIWRYVSWLCTF